MSPGNGHRDRVENRSTRRVFIGRFLGGLAIGIPALRVLTGQTPAYAQTGPGSVSKNPSPLVCTGSCPGPCSKTYLKLNGCGCGGYSPPFNISCKGPAVEKCICSYTVFSATQTGYVCDRFTEQEGYCS